MNRKSGTMRTNQPVCMLFNLLKRKGMKRATTIGKKINNTKSKKILLSNE